MKKDKNYRGVIVEESLIDTRIVNTFNIVRVKISNDDMPETRWHLYTVSISKKEIEKMSSRIKPGWYMNFWRDKEMIVVFSDQQFEFNVEDLKARERIVEHGLAQDIPKEQLDFAIVN